MDLSDLIEASAVMPALKANSKKQLLQLLAEKAAALTGIPEREIFDTILQRERLGSTGVGNGIAIPHGKLAGVKRSPAFLRGWKRRSISRRWTTSQSTSLPAAGAEGAGADHLKALSRIARVLRDPDTVKKIRGTRTPPAIHALLSTSPTSTRPEEFRHDRTALSRGFACREFCVVLQILAWTSSLGKARGKALGRRFTTLSHFSQEAGDQWMRRALGRFPTPRRSPGRGRRTEG